MKIYSPKKFDNRLFVIRVEMKLMQPENIYYDYSIGGFCFSIVFLLSFMNSNREVRVL